MFRSARARTVTLVAAASLALGAAAWASRAVLDEVIVDGVRRRIALVPGWETPLAFTLLGLLAAGGLSRAAARSRRRGQPAVDVGDLVLPLFGLLLLLIPFLPGLPDRWPMVQVLAGPAKWIVWAVVAGQCLWIALPHLAWLRRWVEGWPLTATTAALWLATAAAAATGASQLTHTVLFPSGDEPHYLVIAQSLWRDGDLKIENNHTRGDFREYFNRPDLAPHFLRRGVDEEIYSVHPIGMPVMVAPVYAASGYDGTVIFFIALGATAAAVAWRWVLTLTTAPGPTTLAWAAIVFSAPFLINTFTIYPEVPAALVMASGAALAIRARPDTRRWHGWALGLLAASLPWLSTKYAPMSAALVAVAAARRWWPLHASERRTSWIGAALPIVVPYGLSLIAWFAFFYAYWGTPLPQGPYGSMSQTELANTTFGVPGLFFDQEYGLLVYAPAYVLAGFGLWTMVRRPGPLRRVGLEVGLLFAALTFTVGAFRIWWGGSAAPARPLVSGLLLLMLPMAVQIGSARAGSPRRAAQHLLVWIGIGIVPLLVFAEGGLLVSNLRDGTSALLGWLSPRWPLWSVVPTFIVHEPRTALAGSLVWIAAVGFGSWLLTRLPAPTPGRASLAAQAATVGVVLIALAAWTLLPAPQPPLPTVDLRARPRLAALDSFDHVVRPFAVRYTPLRFDDARAIEPTLAVEVTPGLRPEPQPMRMLHNGRFSLPAGNYRVRVRWAAGDSLPARGPTTIALQVGRIGPALRQWPVTPSPGASWDAEFWLPVDAGFVGFRGTPELERSIDELRIEAIDVADAGVRTPTPQVLAAAAYGDKIVLFHDERMYPESRGFWAAGGGRVRLTIACPGGCTDGVALRAHSGLQPNRLRLSTHGWSETLDLHGETLVPVQVPPVAGGGAIALDLETPTGFVPIEIDPARRDRRYLGAWIEVVPAGQEP